MWKKIISRQEISISVRRCGIKPAAFTIQLSVCNFFQNIIEFYRVLRFFYTTIFSWYDVFNFDHITGCTVLLSNKLKIFGSETERKDVKPLPYCWHLLAFLPVIVQHFSVCRFVQYSTPTSRLIWVVAARFLSTAGSWQPGSSLARF